ncbi:MAG: nucleotidyltransferase domain-containing protein [Candidatus Aenigmarchaeota archaeon]|nr:nucleotidyltransferase domain-containing protein [Candidatus Aenigmarchaeota archaeon]
MIYMYKLNFTKLQQEIMRFLFMNAGESFNARNLALHIKVSQPAIAKSLPLLQNHGIIHVSKDRNSKRLTIELNRENPLVIGMKRADNIRQLYESGLVEFLREKFPSCTIMVFGSFARGEDTSRSDIDIAIVGAKSNDLDLRDYEKTFAKKVNINFYNSFKEISSELRNNIFGGILLSGWIDL